MQRSRNLQARPQGIFRGGALLLAGVTAVESSAHAWSDWVFQSSPGPGDHGNILYDVDGLADDDVWAVGRSDFGPGFNEPIDSAHGLTIHWDGSSWAQFPTPNPGSFWNDLLGVKAIAADDVWVVGSAANVNSGIAQFVAMHWDGKAWNQVPTPALTGGSFASAVDAVTANDLWVVGGRGGGVALAARWNGSGFQIDNMPPAGSDQNWLQAVDAVSTNDVWAVGHYNSGEPDSHPLIMRFNGTAWAIHLASFTLPQDLVYLRGVAAVVPNDVWAVGSHSVGSEGTQPLILHYDGVTWSVHALPIFPDGPAELRALAAHGPDNVWAAGTHATAEGVPRPLIMHYNGSQWTVVEAADTGGSHEWFRGVAAVPDGSGSGDAWVVGQFYNGQLTTTCTQQRPAQSQVPGDVDGDGQVNITDLLALLSDWGPCPASCPADLNGDSLVNVEDLLILLGNWG